MRERERKYYRLDWKMGFQYSPLRVWMNEEHQRKGLLPDAGKPFHGLLLSEPPKISFDRVKRRRGPLIDIQAIILGVWLVSDRVKAVFERIDPGGFEFMQTEVDYSNFDTPGPGFWFCDTTRLLDCVDEQRSKIICQEGIPYTNYITFIDVKMLPDAVGEAHAFRLKKSTLVQVVDDVLVDAVKAEKLKGFHFRPLQQPPPRKSLAPRSAGGPWERPDNAAVNDGSDRRTYHRIDVHRDSTSNAPYAIWKNERKLRSGLRWDYTKPFGGLVFSELPEIAFDRWKRNGPLHDAYPMMLDIWLVSDRVRALFERLDPEAFVFAPSEVDYSNFEKPGPAFWLCHIVRQLDCVDEEASFINYHNPGRKYLSLIKAKMRPEIVGSAHAFFLERSVSTKIIDDVIVDSIKAENITGFHIRAIPEP
jgi:hypothetical protein